MLLDWANNEVLKQCWRNFEKYKSRQNWDSKSFVHFLFENQRNCDKSWKKQEQQNHRTKYSIIWNRISWSFFNPIYWSKETNVDWSKENWRPLPKIKETLVIIFHILNKNVLLTLLSLQRCCSQKWQQCINQLCLLLQNTKRQIMLGKRCKEPKNSTHRKKLQNGLQSVFLTIN